MTLQEIWQDFAGRAGILEQRPDFKFDPAFYLDHYKDIAASGLDALTHYEGGGAKEGRKPTRYQQYLDQRPDLDKALLRFITHPELREALLAGIPDAGELAFELIMLGEPADRGISNFSAEYYFALYRDVEAAGVSAFPHYLNHGAAEGRRSLGDLLQHQYEGRRRFDPSRPTCMICVHEFSKTGAPIVGLDIVRSAAETHNVVVVSLRGGTLLEAFRDDACVVIVSDRPAEEMDYFSCPALDAVEFAILNSVECFSFQKLLVARNIPSAHYLHEYTEYTRPASKLAVTSLFADLLVFSSRQVRASWEGIFADTNFDQARDTVIVPQHDLHFGTVSQKEFDDARASLSKALGRDCTGKRIIFGAGHAQWRKGSDLFVMAAQISAATDPDTIFVWIGDGLNHEDVFFGAWQDKHMAEAGANDPKGSLFFIPAGPEYLNVCRAADAMFLSSRLDPLPNVVFDATRFGCRVVLFADASGFDDVMYTDGGVLETVPYGDVIAASEALAALPAKVPGRALASDPSDEGSVFDRIRAALYERIGAQRRFTVGRGRFDAPVAQGRGDAHRDARRQEREKIWSTQRRWVWRSADQARAEIASADEWAFQRCRIVASSPGARQGPFNLHVHVDDANVVGADLRRHPILAEAQRVVVTADEARIAEKAQNAFARAGVDPDVIVADARGRDVLPFLSLFNDGLAAADDTVWAHIHTRTAIADDTRAGLTRSSIMQGLFGDGGALSTMAEGAGISAPFTPYMIDWAASRGLANEIASRLPGPPPARPLVFPLSNMLLVRGRVAARMAELFNADYPWPNEPMASDGTVLQLIERLWPTMARSLELDAIFVEPNDNLVEDAA
ncbi:MAG: glycosyltransferase [Pikeienuella sp.]